MKLSFSSNLVQKKTKKPYVLFFWIVLNINNIDHIGRVGRDTRGSVKSWKTEWDPIDLLRKGNNWVCKGPK